MRAPRGGRRWAVGSAVVTAVVVAALTGWYPWAKLTPAAPAATLRPGQGADLDGVGYRLDRFVLATSLPPADPKDDAVSGPPGSTLVLVVVSQTVHDRSVRPDDHFCDATLTDGAGTTWQTDSDFTSLIARPAAYGCASTDTAPLRYDVPRETGFSFVVPSGAVGRLSARLAVTDGPTLALLPAS